MRFLNIFKIAMALGLSLSFIHAATAAPQVKVRADLGQEAMVAGKTQKTYLKISLEGLKLDDEGERTPVNVAIVIDRSGSMRGEKLERAKEAAIMAMNRLSEDDVASVVVYDQNVDVIVPAAHIEDYERIERKIRHLRPGGQTALYAGVKQGIDELEKYFDREKVNRVILLSDGLANVGPSSPSALGELGRKVAAKGISVTTIGLGLGYNEDLMAKLAFNSDGNHAFVESPDDLVGIFNSEFGDVLSVVAQEVEIEIIFRPGFRPLRALGREAEMKRNRVTYRFNQLYGAQEKEAVLELEIKGDRAKGRPQIADVKVTYLNMGTKKTEVLEEEVAVRFTKSVAEAEASLNKDVMVSVTSQIAIERNEEAVKLRDKGKTSAARKLLRDNAAYINQQAKRVGGSSVLSEMETSNMDDASNLAKPNWTKYRKGMRAKQHRGKTQQAY